MITTRRGTATRAKDIAALLCGSIILLAILGIFVGALAIPVYVTAIFVEELGGPKWLSLAAAAALGSAELYGLVFLPSYLDRLDDRESS